MTSPELPDGRSLAERRISAQNLLDGTGPFDPNEHKKMPTASDLLLERYDDYAMGDDQEGDGDLNQDGRPAPLTVVPTTTTNPNRPRTLAAGYDYARKTLTVLFRDGVLFNFYNVDVAEWLSFKGTFSKGVWLEDHFPRGGSWLGEKVTGGRNQALAEAIYLQAQASQQANVGKQATGVVVRTWDQDKISGYRRAVLKYVNRGQGLSARAAQERAKAELTFYRKRRP